MGKFWCNYCSMKLTKDSARVRHQHFTGKNHQLNVEAYWDAVNRELAGARPKREQLDQTAALKATFVIPGLTSSLDTTEVEDSLDRARLPSPLYY